MRTPKTVLRGVFVCFILLGAVFISNNDVLGSVIGRGPNRVDVRSMSSDLTPSPSPSPTPIYLQLPLVFRLSEIKINGAWLYNSEGDVQYGYQPGDAIQFVVEIANYSANDASVNLTWSQDGPCGESLIMNRNLQLEPGIRKEITDDIAPDCFGVYSNTIDLSIGTQTESLDFISVVINSSSVILAQGQGFDNCTLPTVSQMATWWEDSPYSTINLYIGGISAVCPMNRDSGWLYQVAEQGWSFIVTWAGPQAPIGCPEDCKYRYPISEDPDIAYQEGKAEADAAVEAAFRRGFSGDLVIYYDIESYSGADANTREAVASLLQGWTERLHELGYKSGAYGAPCTSYITDWAANDDPPDDVWIAHWYTNNYDPDATVGDDPVNIPCLSDDLWANHQRLKQYTGGHKETWGGLKMSIDSNVLDGQVSAILDVPPAQESHLPSGSDSSVEILKSDESTVKDFQILSMTDGWIQYGERLYWTTDGGSSWREITPPSIGSQRILGAVFLNTRQGWSITGSYPGLSNGSPSVLRTMDSGNSWDAFSLPGFTRGEILEVESAFLDFVDSNTGWIALKLQSGSNFSLGRLFATQDGGLTWEERTIPLGEAVEFLDADRGWVAGGPAGDQLFRTVDGGRTWQSQSVLQTDIGQREIGLPVFEDQVSGALSLIERDAGGTRLFLFTTADAGGSWSLSETIQLSPDDARSTSNLAVSGVTLSGELPQGMVALDMFDSQRGWALVQDGSCTGYKPPAGEIAPQGSPPLLCESNSDLLMTTDGGKSWRVISIPN